ncbi:MAG: tetratricopeptide repeat protein [Brevinemataceae bacterium]
MTNIKILFATLLILPLQPNYSQEFLKNSTVFSIDHSKNLYLDVVNINNLSTPGTQKKYMEQLITFTLNQQYKMLLKESCFFLKKFPYTAYSNEIIWLQGYAMFSLEQYTNAETKLISLTNISNDNIKYPALFALGDIAITKASWSKATNILNTIYSKSDNPIFKELALIKLIRIKLSQNKTTEVHKLIEIFQTSYPDSKYTLDLHYYLTLNEVLSGNTKKAELFANSLLEKNDNPMVRRLIAEVSLADKNYSKALERILPLTKTSNKFQDEALFKSALIYKMTHQLDQAHKNLTILVKYFKHSAYYQRALEELANINILLKNYNDALSYFLHQSGFSGNTKAKALSKIVEIYFLKGDIKNSLRSAKRIQNEFPYSKYANESLYWTGRTYIVEKRFEESIHYFDCYLLREPQSPKKEEILIFLGYAYYNIGNLSKARAQFQQIINFSKNEQLFRNALIGLGKSYSKNEPTRSLEFFDQVWIKWPTSQEAPQALYFAGAARYNLRKNNEALQNFTLITNSFPQSHFYDDAVLALAKLDYKFENFTNILDLENISTNSSNKETVSQIKELQARSHLRTENTELALKNFEEALSITEDHERKMELLLASAATLKTLGRYNDSTKKYEQYLVENTTSEDLTLQELILSEIAMNYADMENIPKVLHTVKRLSDQNPRSPYLQNIYFKVADDQFIQKNYKTAAENYQKIIDSSDDQNSISDALLKKAWSLKEAKSPLAETCFTKFLQQYPNHDQIPSVLGSLADIYETTNPEQSTLLRQQIIKEYSSSIEAEKARNSIVKMSSANRSINDLEQIIAQTQDKGLKLKYSYELGKKWEAEGHNNKALEIFLEINKSLDPTIGACAAFKAANILNQQEKYEESMKLYINIITQYNEQYYPKALDLIIDHYTKQDDLENAEKIKNRLLNNYPNSPEAKKRKN